MLASSCDVRTTERALSSAVGDVKCLEAHQHGCDQPRKDFWDCLGGSIKEKKKKAVILSFSFQCMFFEDAQNANVDFFVKFLFISQLSHYKMHYNSMIGFLDHFFPFGGGNCAEKCIDCNLASLGLTKRFLAIAANCPHLNFTNYSGTVTCGYRWDLRT